ncbi:small conductance calcium-activated potassium channel protein 3-like [Mya arenaria]|uniref:small conductance calcium-activated potassium channel protein 3-like n=1 Tax=Mya arenaria TaxID=6604 RepID=UPI0022E5AE7B|nr:small conductance calcium-activated potassium channel protein 3-like [Mya arenaria]
MSTLIEDPQIPLVGMNGRNKLYSDGSAESDSESNALPSNRPYRFETVGKMLAKRKELFHRRKRHCDVSLCLALAGIGLMIFETELTTAFLIRRDSLLSYLMKTCITAFTVALLIFLGIYHYLDVQLFAVDNGVDDLRLAMSFRRVLKIAVEFIICSIHPIPGDFKMEWSATVADGQYAREIIIPLDVVLSLPMFLRFYLICRAIMLHSSLYQDALSQGLGALNRIHFNFRFIFKSLMTLYPEYVLAIIMLFSFLTSSWALRLCEMYGEGGLRDDVHASFLNCLWLIAVTFLSVGYGDIVPTTYCGRGIAVITGMMGAGCTALVVAVLARRLELSRSEKYVHDFVIDVELDKRLKHNAADVMRAGWFVFKYRKLKTDKSRIIRHQRKLLLAVENIRDIRSAQRRLIDNSVTLVEIGKYQNESNRAIHLMQYRQSMLEENVGNIQTNVEKIFNSVSQIKEIIDQSNN